MEKNDADPIAKMIFYAYPAKRFKKCQKCGSDLILIPKEESIFALCKVKQCRKKEVNNEKDN